MSIKPLVSSSCVSLASDQTEGKKPLKQARSADGRNTGLAEQPQGGCYSSDASGL